MQRLLCALAILSLTSGCTVYKSSDRDDFNSHGKDRAPAAAAQLSADDRDLLENPCTGFNEIHQEDLNAVFGDRRVSMTNQISEKTSTCLLEAPPRESDSEPLDHVSILMCSWKPVDGSRIPVSTDEMNLQTTEDDLRANGFSVVSSTVVSGASLRLNCEAYAPITDLAWDARENNEKAREALGYHFAVLGIELTRATLTTTQQK